MKLTTDSMALCGRTIGRVTTERTNSGDYNDGCVVTPYGIVSVYAQGGGNSFPHTRLDFGLGGRLYMEQRNVRLTKRGLATAAKRFAKRITEEARR